VGLSRTVPLLASKNDATHVKALNILSSGISRTARTTEG